MREDKMRAGAEKRGGIPGYLTLAAIIISVISLYLQKRQAVVIENLKQENAALKNALALLDQGISGNGGSSE